VSRQPPQWNPGIPIREFVFAQAGALIRRFFFEMHRVARLDNADAIHDLRVSIRRLHQFLRLFRQFFPRSGRKQIRRELSALMAQAARVRNCDIALELLQRAKLGPDSPSAGLLKEERSRESRRLQARLKGQQRQGTLRRWRSRLGF